MKCEAKFPGISLPSVELHMVFGRALLFLWFHLEHQEECSTNNYLYFCRDGLWLYRGTWFSIQRHYRDEILFHGDHLPTENFGLATKVPGTLAWLCGVLVLKEWGYYNLAYCMSLLMYFQFYTGEIFPCRYIRKDGTVCKIMAQPNMSYRLRMLLDFAYEFHETATSIRSSGFGSNPLFFAGFERVPVLRCVRFNFVVFQKNELGHYAKLISFF